MLFEIVFESFDLFMVKRPNYNFLLKECKGMLKMMQLISNFLHKKNMFPFITCSLCQFDERKNHMKISKS
jgi:hypothetical protein